MQNIAMSVEKLLFFTFTHLKKPWLQGEKQNTWKMDQQQVYYLERSK